MNRRTRRASHVLLSSLVIAAPAIGAAHASAATAPARAAAVLQRLAAILRLGSTGPDVAALQRVLGVPADGVYGRATVRAVRAFQAAHGLEVDGEAGPATLAAVVAEAQGRPGDVVLALGDRGGDVSAVQWAVGLPATARYTKGTARAVRRYQRRHGLVADGQAGPETLSALNVGVEQASRPAPSPTRAPAPDSPSAPTETGPVDESRAAVGRRAASLALTYLGVPYVWGGESPETGFDCSGLVEYVYGRVGIDLPRVAADQYGAGPHVAMADLLPGDLVFFEHLNHVGIYLGNGRFVHAPHTGEVVRISRLDGWYVDNYVGATRVW